MKNVMVEERELKGLYTTMRALPQRSKTHIYIGALI